MDSLIKDQWVDRIEFQMELRTGNGWDRRRFGLSEFGVDWDMFGSKYQSVLDR